MTLRVTASITLIVFVVCDCSCTVYRAATQRPEEISGTRGDSLEVLSVTTNAGETIEFGEQTPGWIRGEMVEGYAEYPDTMTIAKSEVVETERDKSGRLQTVFIQCGEMEGRRYNVESVISGSADSLSLVVTSREMSTIPLSTVEVLQIRTVDAAKTFTKLVGGTVLLAGLGLVICAAIYGYPFVPQHL